MTDPTLDRAAAENRNKAIFEQDCLEFRSLNGILWQIPLLVSTLTGGLWFGVTKVENDGFVQGSLYILAAAVNAAFIVVLWRLRVGVMEPILVHVRTFQGRGRPSGSYLVVTVFSVLLAISAGVSLVAFVRASGLWTTFLHRACGA